MTSGPAQEGGGRSYERARAWRPELVMREELKWYDDRADSSPWIDALAELRQRAAREGNCYQQVQAMIVAIDQYAEKALGNRDHFLNKPYGAGWRGSAVGRRNQSPLTLDSASWVWDRRGADLFRSSSGTPVRLRSEGCTSISREARVVIDSTATLLRRRNQTNRDAPARPTSGCIRTRSGEAARKRFS